MKKLAITSVVVLIALIGFTAVLYFLPGGDCCVKKEGCEMRMHDQQCSGDMGKHEGCGKGQGHHDGCMQEKRMVKEWKDADGKVHKEVKVIIGGEGDGMEMRSCPMESGDHSGCCGCCMMKQGGGSCKMIEIDSI